MSPRPRDPAGVVHGQTPREWGWVLLPIIPHREGAAVGSAREEVPI